ncbi:inositol phosphorylceramide synthase [Rhodococcus hoagii]|nr:inositol phosphorylceramide synthase [Prescottella equi]NKR27329.1 inositol phosphorylceramide synthase [Prescottella equi]NKR59609.1 inositol phosphorylceramide synthase [Prescottella equi]NKR94525.1 inositol phosphorylceramide synthase [Prescottella equi]
MNGVLVDGGARTEPVRLSDRTRNYLIGGVVAAGIAVLIALQVFASSRGFEGPLTSLLNDFVGTPKSASVPWAGLALAMVGLTNRQRVLALSSALVIDVVVAGIRYLAGGSLTVGNGAVIVLTAIGVWAGWKWSGEQRRNALMGVGLGALLIVATKFGDVWLHITVLAGPEVLDQYVQLADHALGNPSWVMGNIVDATGSVGYAVLHWVYIELPVAAIVVALYQLRKGWPSHHLVRTFLLIGLIGPVFYILFPVVGPIFAFGADGNGFQVGDFWPSVVPFDLTPSPMPFDDATPRNCMPSLHTAWALALFLHSRQGPRWLRWGGTFWLVCTLSATLGFGYHYGVDLIAGVVLTLTLESALRAPERGWGWFRVRLVAGGAVLLGALLLSYRFLAVEIAEYPIVSAPLLLGVPALFAYGYWRTFYRAAASSRFAHLSLPQDAPTAR